MKKAIKILFLITIFLIMISSIASASFMNTQSLFSESANMVLLGIVLISLGSFIRQNHNNQ